VSRHSGEPPHHRNLTCYVNYGCRLADCVDRYREWNRSRASAKRAGQWQPHVDAEPVRRHLRKLEEHGISIRQAATLAGVGARSLHPLFTRPIRHTVRPEIAAAVLAIDPEQATPTRIDATGTARRIQALVADGWPMAHLAEHIGVYRSYVHALIRRHDDGQKILASTAVKVAAGYEQLAGKRPAKHGINLRQVKQARNLAASRRWAPTSYWADRMDVIDDPDFEPLYGVTKREIVAQDANELMRFSGLDKVAAAQRLGVSKSYIEHAFRDHPEYAVEVAA
jgi:lambda repressor-like predicted transcriptional regulator